jgi:hypothetical protein
MGFFVSLEGVWALGAELPCSLLIASISFEDSDEEIVYGSEKFKQHGNSPERKWATTTHIRTTASFKR